MLVAVLAVVVVMVVVVTVMVVVMMSVVMSVMMIVVMADAMVTPKPFAQGELGSQLSDGLPLIQDGLLLSDKTFTQVQDSGFSVIGHHAPTAATTVVITVCVTAWSMGHTGW